MAETRRELCHWRGIAGCTTKRRMQVAAAESVRTRWVIAGLSAVVVLAVAVLLLGRTDAVGPAPTVREPGTLATVNAALNGAAFCCLVLGFVFIKQKRVRAHRASMIAAFGISTAFLVTYVLHHAQVGSVPYRGVGWARTVYFAILIPHIVLAVPVVPLALLTLYRGWTDRVEAHRTVARWTWPLWAYVSLSGVLVFWMLYQ